MTAFHPKNKAWAKRELVCEPRIGGPIFVLVYLVIGIPGIAIIAVVLRDVLRAPDEQWPTLVNLVIGVAAWMTFLAFVTSLWWRGYRYGSSVCRLITMPGAVGGWFKADIECRLPPGDTDTVIVRLINLKVSPQNIGMKQLWHMDQKLTVPSSKARRIVPVRMQVPRDPRQLLTGQMAQDWRGATWGVWLLKIEKKARGVDFSAEFSVPVCDIREGNPEEQRPD
jgi:hypothetical protein